MNTSDLFDPANLPYVVAVLGICNQKFRWNVIFKSDGRSGQLQEARLDARKQKITVDIADGTNICAPDNDACKWNGFIGTGIENPSFDGPFSFFLCLYVEQAWD